MHVKEHTGIPVCKGVVRVILSDKTAAKTE